MVWRMKRPSRKRKRSKSAYRGRARVRTHGGHSTSGINPKTKPGKSLGTRAGMLARSGVQALIGDYVGAAGSAAGALIPSYSYTDIKRNAGTGSERQVAEIRHKKKSVSFKRPKKVHVSKNFKAKVIKTLDRQDNHGSFREISYNALNTNIIPNGQQLVALLAPNSTNVTNGWSTDTQYDWSPWAFDPENLLHQLSVLFNNKANSQNTIREWYAQHNFGVMDDGSIGAVPIDNDGGTNANTSSSTSRFPMQVKFTIKKSYEVYKLKNNSQRTLHCKIYLFAPKTTATKSSTTAYINASGAITLVNTQDYISDPVSSWFAANSQQYNQTINVAGAFPTTLYMTPLANPLLKKNFNIEETTVVIEPGQSYSYTISGPSNFEIDFQKMFKPNATSSAAIDSGQNVYMGVQKFMRCPMIVCNQDLVQTSDGSGITYRPGRYPGVTSTLNKYGLVIERDVVTKFKMPDMTGGVYQNSVLSTARTIQNQLRRSCYAHYVYSLSSSTGYFRWDEENPQSAQSGV